MSEPFGIERLETRGPATINTRYRIWDKRCGTTLASIPEIFVALVSQGQVRRKSDATDAQRLAELESSQAVLRGQVRELAGEVEKLWGECGYKYDDVRGNRKYRGESGIEYVVPDGRYLLGEFKCPCCGRPAMILQGSVTTTG